MFASVTKSQCAFTSWQCTRQKNATTQHSVSTAYAIQQNLTQQRRLQWSCLFQMRCLYRELFFIYLLDIQTNTNWKMWLCVKTHRLLVWRSTATWIFILLHDVCLYLGVWLWHGISMNGGKMKSECFWGDDCYARTSGCLNRFGFRCFLQWEHPTVFSFCHDWEQLLFLLLIRHAASPVFWNQDVVFTCTNGKMGFRKIKKTYNQITM